MWVWASSGTWWWTGKPGMLQSLGSQRVGHHWATEPQQTLQLDLLISSLAISSCAFLLLLLLQPCSTFCCSSKLPSHGWLKASACWAFYSKINFYRSVVVLQCCVNSAIQQSKSTVCTHSSPLYAPRFSWNALLPVISTPSPCSPLLTAIFSMIPSLTHYSKMATTFPEFLIHLLCFIFFSRSWITIVFMTYLLVLIILSSPSLQGKLKRVFTFMFCSYYLKQGLAHCSKMIIICWK